MSGRLKIFSISTGRLCSIVNTAEIGRIGKVTHLVDDFRKVSSNLLVERGSDLMLHDRLQRWEHRRLHLALDSHLDDSGSVARELSGDELQNFLLA